MKKQLFSFLLLITLAFSVSAQENESRKIDEISSLWRSETLRNVDNFLFELQDDPKAMGFVIFYEGKYLTRDKNSKTKMLYPKYGETSCRVQAIRDHIKLRRTFPINRVLFIDGGFREEQTTELWIVPNNAELPKPSPTLDTMKYRKGKPFCNYQDFY